MQANLRWWVVFVSGIGSKAPQDGNYRKTGQQEVSRLQEDLGGGLSVIGCIFQVHVIAVKHLIQADFEEKRKINFACVFLKVQAPNW